MSKMNNGYMNTQWMFDINFVSNKKDKIISECMTVAEKMTQIVGSCNFAMKDEQDSQIVPTDSILHLFNSTNWFLACNFFKLGTNVTATKKGSSYEMIVEFTEKDFYYWDDDEQKWSTLNGLMPGTILEKDVRDLHLAGTAKNYETKGSCKYSVKWNAGESLKKAVITEI